MEGRSETLLSSWKRIQAFRRRAFFYCRPTLGHPALSCFLIPFPRLPSRPLQAPFHGGQNLPHMAGMIMDPGNPFDNRRDLRQHRRVGGETVRRRSAPQHLVQSRAPAGTTATTDPTRLIRAPCFIPSTYALPADLKPAPLSRKFGRCYLANRLPHHSSLKTGPVPLVRDFSCGDFAGPFHRLNLSASKPKQSRTLPTMWRVMSSSVLGSL